MPQALPNGDDLAPAELRRLARAESNGRDGHRPKAFERLLRYRRGALAELWRSLGALEAL